MATVRPKPPLRWGESLKGPVAYDPFAVRTQYSRGEAVTKIFARLVYRIGEGWYVWTNDWKTTDNCFATEEEARRVVEAMWALED